MFNQQKLRLLWFVHSSSFKRAPPIIHYCRDPLEHIAQQWIAARTKGEDFMQDPAIVLSSDGERQYGHPLSADWALTMHKEVNSNPKVKAHAAAGGCAQSHLLLYTMFSDKTSVGNNLSVYPVQISMMNCSAKAIHDTFAGGHGVVAYIPTGHKSLNATSEQHTEETCKLTATCFREVRGVWNVLHTLAMSVSWCILQQPELWFHTCTIEDCLSLPGHKWLCVAVAARYAADSWIQV